MDCIICRYGEIALKGKNRGLFEGRLVRNIQDCLNRNNIDSSVKKVRGRIYVHTSDKEALKCLKRVFGLVSISPATVVENDVDKIISKSIDHINSVEHAHIKTFRISARRTNKQFSKNSGEMDILLGDAINSKFGFGVNLTSPDLNLGVEIHDNTYIFHEKIDCFGGLPLGMTGKVACLIRNEQDVLAAWLVMRRGCETLLLLRGIDDYSPLDNYDYGATIQKESIEDIGAAKEIIDTNKCKALVVGDLLEEFRSDKYSGAGVAALTPLIAYTPEQISELTENIR